MKETLFMMLLAMATTIFAAITVLQQYYQTAQAFPCVGHSAKEYCRGYHDGAVQANRDYKTGNDLDLDQRSCTAAALYCDGYSRGYHDQADFLD
jgi:hypothetical protein